MEIELHLHECIDEAGFVPVEYWNSVLLQCDPRILCKSKCTEGGIPGVSSRSSHQIDSDQLMGGRS